MSPRPSQEDTMSSVVQKETEIMVGVLIQVVAHTLGSLAVKRHKIRGWVDVGQHLAAAFMLSMIYTTVLNVNHMPYIGRVVFIAAQYASIALRRWCLQRDSVVLHALCNAYESTAIYYLHTQYNINWHYTTAEIGCKLLTIVALVFVHNDPTRHPYYNYNQRKILITNVHAAVYMGHFVMLSIRKFQDVPVLLLMLFLCYGNNLYLFELRQRLARAKPASVVDKTRMRRPKDWTDDVEFKQTSCGICLDEDIVSRGGLLELPCAHIFHDGCVSIWFQKHGTCPTCKGSVSVLPAPVNSPEVTNAV